MKIAIFGATSYLARDLILSFSHKNKASDIAGETMIEAKNNHHLFLYGRSKKKISAWLQSHQLNNQQTVMNYSSFNLQDPFDAIINFVGVGDPANAMSMGASIFDITQQYDTLALNYIQQHPKTKYIFLSSGAVYGNAYSSPAHEHTQALIDINHISATDYYGIAKLYTEARHRSMTEFNIVDLRVFNYFSATIDLTTRFFISDILRAIKHNETLKTTSNNMVRDYLHPDDLYQMIMCILSTKTINQAIDCYTQQPVDKITLLDTMAKHFGLKYITTTNHDIDSINATGQKEHYYSINRRAELIGYKPGKSSLDGILQEAPLALKHDNDVMYVH